MYKLIVVDGVQYAVQDTDGSFEGGQPSTAPPVQQMSSTIHSHPRTAMPAVVTPQNRQPPASVQHNQPHPQVLQPRQPGVRTQLRLTGVQQPLQRQPLQRQHLLRQPLQRQPGVLRPQQSQPVVLRPQQSQPGVMRPQQSQPGMMRPQQSQPGVMRPQQSQLGMMRPQQSQPVVMRPQQSQPGVMRPQQRQLGVMRPQQGAPGVQQPLMGQTGVDPVMQNQQADVPTEKTQQPPPTMLRREEHLPQMNARNKGGVPGIHEYVTINKTPKKLGDIIFESGKDLLEEIIERAAHKFDVIPYSPAEHLGRLNIMFPDTVTYDPPVMTTRIQSYVQWARKQVELSKRTGQGMHEDDVYGQEATPEQIIINLLEDANKSTTPAKATGAGYSLSKESLVSQQVLDNLEERPFCVLCHSDDEDLTSTDLGEVCSTCLKDQGDWIQEEEGTGHLEVEARIQQNAALTMMDMGPSSAGGKGSNGDENSSKRKATNGTKSGGKNRRTRKYSFSSDEDDQDIKVNQMLMAQFEQAKEKDRLEILKLELEIENLRNKN